MYNNQSKRTFSKKKKNNNNNRTDVLFKEKQVWQSSLWVGVASTALTSKDELEQNFSKKARNKKPFLNPPKFLSTLIWTNKFIIKIFKFQILKLSFTDHFLSLLYNYIFFFYFLQTKHSILYILTFKKIFLTSTLKSSNAQNLNFY